MDVVALAVAARRLPISEAGPVTVGAKREPESCGSRRLGGSVVVASFATGRLLVFVGLAMVARLVGPEEYGLFAMAAAGFTSWKARTTSG